MNTTVTATPDSTRRGRAIGRTLVAAVAGAVVMVLAGTSAAYAVWSSVATSTASVSAGTVAISNESSVAFDRLTHTYRAGALEDTEALVARNTGTVAASYTLSFGAQSANALATGILVRVWTVASTTACTASTSVPSSASSSNWTTVPAQSGNLVPDQSVVYCVRTSITTAQASSLGGATMTATAQLRAAVGSWVSTRNWTATQQVQVPADTTAPSQPGTPVASATTGTGTTLTWTASTDNVGVTGYRVFRNSVQIATVPGTTFTDTGLTGGTTYSYTVRAIDAAGNASTLSGARSVTTTASAVVDPTAWYQVRSSVNGTCLMRNGSSTNLLFFDCYPSAPDQQWQFTPTSGGYYKVSSKATTSDVWAVSGASTADRATVTLQTWNSQSSQQWLVEKDSSGQFRFVNRNSARCLDANGAGFSAPQQRTCVAGDPQQLFSLTKVG